MMGIEKVDLYESEEIQEHQANLEKNVIYKDIFSELDKFKGNMVTEHLIAQGEEDFAANLDFIGIDRYTGKKQDEILADNYEEMEAILGRKLR